MEQEKDINLILGNGVEVEDVAFAKTSDWYGVSE
jgi:hypothetical protein